MSGPVEALGHKFLEWTSLEGLDWSRYDEQGYRLDKQGFNYKDDMLERERPFWDVIATLTIKQHYRELRATQGAEAITVLYARLKDAAGDVFKAIKDGRPFLAMEKGLSVDGEVYQTALATVAAYAADGAQLHYDGIMDDAVHLGSITAAERQRHADTVTRIFEAFVYLDEGGYLDDLKADRPTAGVGVAPLAAGWVIVAVVGIIGLCYLVWAVFIASRTQDKVVEWCDKLIERGGSEQAQYCVDSLQNMQNESVAQLFAPINKVAMAAGVGLVVYFGVMLMPSLIESAQQLREP